MKVNLVVKMHRNFYGANEFTINVISMELCKRNNSHCRKDSNRFKFYDVQRTCFEKHNDFCKCEWGRVTRTVFSASVFFFPSAKSKEA